MSLELREIIGDLEPRCLGADEDMRRGPNAGGVRERAHRDVHVRAPRTTEKSREPHTPQRVSFNLSSPTTSSASRPSVSSSFSRSMPANGLNAEPVAARQREQ
jgi:hypothetical protein